MSSSTRSSPARRGATLAALLLGATCLIPTVDARSSASGTPDHVSRYIDDARPAGRGRLTWFGLHVYDARLFVPRGFDAADPAAQPFALELTYARNLDGRAIAARSHDEIARLGFGSAAQRERWLEQMTALFPDVRAGQRLAGIYRPGGATRFYVDGRALGEIDDPDFGRAFFAIWLDPRTSAPQLRASLLSPAP
jgi:hypothetical protein